MKKETLDSIDQRATSISVLTGKEYDSEYVLRKIKLRLKFLLNKV